MPGNPPLDCDIIGEMTDLDKARKIVTQRWMSQPESLKENIAKAVAEGIALGRKEGLEMAANERLM